MWAEAFHVLTDPGHWVAEVVMDAVIAGAAWAVGVRRAVRRHDRVAHGIAE